MFQADDEARLARIKEQERIRSTRDAPKTAENSERPNSQPTVAVSSSATPRQTGSFKKSESCL